MLGRHHEKTVRTPAPNQYKPASAVEAVKAKAPAYSFAYKVSGTVMLPVSSSTTRPAITTTTAALALPFLPPLPPTSCVLGVCVFLFPLALCRNDAFDYIFISLSFQFTHVHHTQTHTQQTARTPSAREATWTRRLPARGLQPKVQRACTLHRAAPQAEEAGERAGPRGIQPGLRAPSLCACLFDGTEAGGASGGASWAW